MRRKERIEEIDSTNKRTESLHSALEDMKDDQTVTPRQAVTIAETLREVRTLRRGVAGGVAQCNGLVRLYQWFCSDL